MHAKEIVILLGPPESCCTLHLRSDSLINRSKLAQIDRDEARNDREVAESRREQAEVDREIAISDREGDRGR